MEKYASIKEFCLTDEYQTWQNQWHPPVNDVVWGNGEAAKYSHNQWYPTQREELWHRTASRIPFYLLDTINIGTNRCVDIGCGGNFLSKNNPHIWGIDRNTPTQHEELTPTWYDDNYEKWSKAISICAMHFCPVQMIGESLSNMENILTSGGTGVVTLNRRKIEIMTSPNTYTDELLIEQISTISTITRVVWLDTPHISGLDGNVWIWINK
jgi:hypothetical protein